MPIRKRGNSWQVDVRLPDGKRYRTTVRTEEEARAMEGGLKTNPQQRRAMKRALRQSPDASAVAAAPSTKSSMKGSEKSGRARSKVIILRK